MKAIQFTGYVGTAFTFYYSLINRLPDIGFTIMVTACFLFPTFSKVRRNPILIMTVASGAFLLNKFASLTGLELVILIISLWLCYILFDWIVFARTKISCYVTLIIFLTGNKKPYLFRDALYKKYWLKTEWKRGDMYWSAALAAYKKNNIVIYSKEYFKNKFKLKGMEAFLMEKDTFLKVVSTKPETKDDVIVNLI